MGNSVAVDFWKACWHKISPFPPLQTIFTKKKNKKKKEPKDLTAALVIEDKKRKVYSPLICNQWWTLQPVMNNKSDQPFPLKGKKNPNNTASK